jgi:hypothetical protein
VADEAGAVEALLAARNAGIEPQRVALELAYLRLAQKRIAAARAELETAATGPDLALAEQARKQLDTLPSDWWADVYAESYGWSRVSVKTGTTDLVPTVRVRGMRRLGEKFDAHAYLFRARDPRCRITRHRRRRSEDLRR